MLGSGKIFPSCPVKLCGVRMSLTLTYWRPATWQLSTGASTVHFRYSTDDISAFLHNEDDEDEEEADEGDGIKANA